MKKIIFSLLLLSHFAIAQTPCDVILMAVSQSNGFGFPNNQPGFSWPASAPDPSAVGAQTNIYLWNIDTPGFNIYTAGTNQIWSSITHYFSWDLPVAQAMRDFRGVPQFVLKVSPGGTSIINTAPTNWGDVGGQWRSALQLYISQAKQWLSDNGYDPTFTLLLIDQGEGDSAYAGERYFREQQKAVREVRYWTGNLKLQVIVRQLTNYSTIVTGQNLHAASDSRYYIFSPAGVANYATGDGVHFTGAGLWDMGVNKAVPIAISKSYP